MQCCVWVKVCDLHSMNSTVMLVFLRLQTDNPRQGGDSQYHDIQSLLGHRWQKQPAHGNWVGDQESRERERVDTIVSKEDEDEGKSGEAQKRKSTKCDKG